MKKRAILIVFITMVLLLVVCGLSACRENRPVTGKYKISFDTQGGSTISPLYLSATDTITLPDPPTKSGYEFDGWYLDAACTVAYNPYVFKINSDATLYARWVDVNLYPHKITVADNGYHVLLYRAADGITPDQMSANWDVHVSVSHLLAAKDTRVQIYVLVEKEGYQIKAGSLKSNSLPIEGNSFLMPAEDVVIDFELELKTYSITTLTSGNGSILVSTAEATMGEHVEVIVLPELGYRLNRITYNLTEFEPPFFVMPAGNILVTATFEPIAGDFYPVTATHEGAGSVTLSAASARKGEYVEVTALPAEGYYTQSLKVNGTPIKEGHFVMPGRAAAVEAVFAPVDTSATYAISVDMQITGGSIMTSRTRAANGEIVSLSSTPQTGYTLAYYTVNGAPVSGSVFVMPAEAVTVSAYFSRNAKQLAAEVAVGGVISFLTHEDYAYPGDVVTLKITPDMGYVYKKASLKLNGEPLDGTYFVMPDGDAVVSAAFLPIETGSGANAYTIVQASGIENGSIQLSKTAADAGDLIFIEAIPDAGYRLKAGSLTVNGAPYRAYYQMGEEYAVVTAEFERVYNILYYDGSEGYVYPDRITAAEGETVTLRYGAYGKYKADGAYLYYNNNVAIPGGSFTMPAEDVVLHGVFVGFGIEDYRIDIAPVTNGSVTCSLNYAVAGRAVSLTATPAAGYRLKSVYYLTAANERVEVSTSFLMPAQNINLHAEFEADVGEYDASAFFDANKALVFDNGGKIFYHGVHRAVKNFLQSYSLAAYACYVDEVLFAELNRVFLTVKLNNKWYAPYIAYRLAEGLNAAYPQDTFRCTLYGDVLVISSLPDLGEAYTLLKSGFTVDAGLIYYPRPDGSLGLLTTAPGLSVTALDIPVAVNGRAVTKMAPAALRNLSALKALSLGVIGTLSDSAFRGLTALIQIDLSRVNVIGKEVFKDCLSLEKFAVADYNGRYYTHTNGIALYEKSGSQSYAILLRYAPAATQTTYPLRTGSQKIASYAFYGADNLNELIFSSSLTALEDYALYGMHGLSRLDAGIALQEAGYHSLYWEGSEDLRIVLRSGAKMVASAGEILVRENTGGELTIDILLDSASDSARLNLLNAYRADSVWATYADAFTFTPMTGFQIVVYFESNGGSYVNAVTVNQGVNVSAPSPAPTREGYVLEGWYTDNGTFLNQYNFMAAVFSTLRLYARWVPAS